LWKFCKEIENGDIVLSPDKDRSNLLFVGEIISDYKFVKGEEQPHRREVRWFENKIDRDKMSEELKTSIRSPVTIIDLSRNHSEEIKSLLKGNIIPQKNDFKSKNYIKIIKNYPHPIIAKLLIQFLESTLPAISDDWWEETVINNLKDYEHKKVERETINNLDGLSNDVLLRILDKNWLKISNECSFGYDDLNITKEMISVRNRIAHLSNKGYNNLDDLLRDFDTIQRFIKLIDIDQENIQIEIDELRKIKLNIMQDILQSS
jgi:hypothetical protein